ncbi:PBECR4 domain-containing protein [Eubacterium sp.]|uniref:PBECR4 domain-containing protein n=1 Tax=Eubacterium sp. TaxID=142586 RepID=UPI001D21FCB3|nr:PBECR4 domain-containing protein [Eubacterium sp.]MBS5619792.1 hypothetical protein [Eubacterium sp.]
MYKPEELKELQRKPKINDISLIVLKRYYAMYLVPFIYTYNIIKPSGDKGRIKLKFNKESFCHLLGLETIAKGSVKYKEISEYRGHKGWNNIENGEIDFKHLKNLNKKKFQSVKAKFVYFYLLPDLIEQPMAVLFDNKRVNPRVKIESEILFYNKYENAVIHLGIDKNEKEDLYYPRTFFVEKLGKDNVEDIYTVNQIKITVEKEKRIICI